MVPVRDEIDFRAGDIHQGNLIDHHGHAVAFDDQFVVLKVAVEAEAVLEAGTAAARYGDPQLEIGVVFVLE